MLVARRCIVTAVPLIIKILLRAHIDVLRVNINISLVVSSKVKSARYIK